MTKEDILNQCTVDGNVVKLPPQQLERSLYLEVSKALQLIGGKWKGGKTFGFVFPQDPTDLLSKIANGEKRNLKKEYQFFATPNNLADQLIAIAEIKPEHFILEPSAGQGAIIDAVNRFVPNTIVDCFELMDINRVFLLKNTNVNLIGSNFLEAEPVKKYDRIIANPPFSKNQDIVHIYHMFNFLKNGGMLVSVSSKHWVNSSNKKEKDFSDWLKSLKAEVLEVPAGSFKQSGTMVSGCIVKIIKP